MSTITGVVETKSRAGTGIKVSGVWYNGKTDVLSGIEWKDNVEIDADEKNQINSIKKVGGGSNAGGGNSGGTDWEARQAAITFQSARNAAIELFTTLANTGAVKLPTKEADKYAAAMAFIDEHTVVFHEQAMKVYAGVSAEAAVEGRS